jgi:xanthine dehydrogenase accessory factor
MSDPMLLDKTFKALPNAPKPNAVRVILADLRGSAPREIGAEMVVTPDGITGTIGGGALEWEAIQTARGLTAPRRETHALGPDLGQCCGGRVTLIYLPILDDAPTPGGQKALAWRVDGPTEQPPSVTKALSTLSDDPQNQTGQLVDGWWVEPVTSPAHPLWIWGAGHVGRAIVGIMAPLPDLTLTWVDTGPEHFPQTPPMGVTLIPTPDPARLAAHAPIEAHHLILTRSHNLDLKLCDALLHRGFASLGLIGSATKWARFRSRLEKSGHSCAEIDQITCPIGDPTLGKHPQMIAVGVAHSLISAMAQSHVGGARA